MVSLEAAIVPSPVVTLEMATASHLNGCPYIHDSFIVSWKVTFYIRSTFNTPPEGKSLEFTPIQIIPQLFFIFIVFHLKCIYIEFIVFHLKYLIRE